MLSSGEIPHVTIPPASSTSQPPPAASVPLSGQSTVVHGSIRQVLPSDPHIPLLQKWRPEDSPTELTPRTAAAQRPWFRVTSPTLNTILPGRSIYSVYVGDRHYTIICSDPNTIELELPDIPWGADTKFAEILARSGVAIRGEVDARFVWTAYCDIYGREWYDQPFQQVDTHTWHLGDHVAGAVRYYLDLQIDDTGKIIRTEYHRR